jgi:hypothetical protein
VAHGQDFWCWAAGGRRSSPAVPGMSCGVPPAGIPVAGSGSRHAGSGKARRSNRRGGFRLTRQRGPGGAPAGGAGRRAGPRSGERGLSRADIGSVIRPVITLRGAARVVITECSEQAVTHWMQFVHIADLVRFGVWIGRHGAPHIWAGSERACLTGRSWRGPGCGRGSSGRHPPYRLGRAGPAGRPGGEVPPRWRARPAGPGRVLRSRPAGQAPPGGGLPRVGLQLVPGQVTCAGECFPAATISADTSQSSSAYRGSRA